MCTKSESGLGTGPVLTNFKIIMPSQLKALKTELAKAGLSRSSQPNNKRKRAASSTGDDADHRDSQRQRIHAKFNQFDTKVTKLKHDTAGRKLKGVTGRPTNSKQASIELVSNQ